MLHERDAELALVDRVVAQADTGRSALVAFTGPVGIGRSALLDEAAARSGRAGVRVLRATAARMEQSFAGGIIRQLFEPLLYGTHAEETGLRGWLSGDGAAVAGMFADGFDSAATTSSTTATRLHGLWSLLAVLSAPEPLLITVDDLQWADEESVRLLAYLTNRWSGLRVAVVVGVRDGDPRVEHPLMDAVLLGATESVALAPLSRAATTSLISEILIKDHPVKDGHATAQPEFEAACVEVTAGNPLLLHSTLAVVANAGYGATAEAVDAVRQRCDATTRERIAACLRHQPERTRALAGALAVLAAPADAELIADLADLDPISYAQAILDAHRLGLFGSERPPTPRHPAVREAALSLLTMAELERLHERAAELLRAAGRPAEEVAAHLMRVTRCGQPWVRSVLHKAADEARHRHAPRDAASYLRRALLSAPLDGAERGQLLLDLATAERGFAPADAELHVCQATVLLPDAVSRASALIAHAPTFLGVSTGPLQDLVRAIFAELDTTAMAHPRYDSLRWRLQARSPNAPYGDITASAATVADVLGAERGPSLDSATERDEMAVLLNYAVHSGAVPADRVAAIGRQIMAHEPARAEHVFGAVPLVITSMLIADTADGLGPWLSAALRDAQQANLPYAQLLIHVEQAFVLMTRGRLALARVHVDAADRLSSPDHTPGEDLVGFALAMIAIQSQDLELCESLLRRRHSHLEDPMLGAGQLLLRGSVSAMRGEWHAALQSFQSCGRTLRAGGWINSSLLPWTSGMVVMYQRLGNTEGAFAVLDDEQDRVTRWGAPTAVGRMLRLRAGLTEGADGVDLLRESVEVLRGALNQLELCHSMEALADRLDDDTIRAEARALRRKAGLLPSPTPGSPASAPQVAELGSRSPSAGSPQEKSADEPTELTKTEHRVVTLAVSGLSNQDIAEELSVSLRAVEKHLTRSYRKLRITGRAGLNSGPE
jgi:DNA-binding CsgD family transcriptional regulator